MRRGASFILVAAAFVSLVHSFGVAEEKQRVIESESSAILGGEGKVPALPLASGVEEGLVGTILSTPRIGWGSSIGVSGGVGGSGSGFGSGSSQPCPPEIRKSCDDLDKALCSMIVSIANQLLKDRTGIEPIEPIVKPCEEAIKISPVSRQLLWLMCQSPHLLDEYRRGCMNNELTFCPTCHAGR